MTRNIVKSAVLCALLAIPAVAQERIHLPAPGEADEWCITPIVWTGQDQQQAAELLGELDAAQHRAYLGVDLGDLTDARAKELKLSPSKGALVEHVMPGSPADKAGLKSGDVVVSIDGKAIASGDELRAALEHRESGEKVRLELLRDGKRQTVEATLGARVDLKDRAFFQSPEGMELFKNRMPNGFGFGTSEPYVMMFPGAPKLGVSVLPMTNELREYFGVDHDKGVLVSAVSKGSAAERAGIRAGDVLVTVDGQLVTRAGEIARVLSAGKDTNAPRTIQIELVRDRSRQTVSATVDAAKLMNEE